MEELPALAPQTADPSGGGGEGEGDQQNKSSETGGDERALVHIFQDARPTKKLVEPDVGQKVQRGIEKCKQAEHAAEFYEPGLVQNPAQGRNSQSDAQKDENPVTGGMRDFFNGIGAQIRIEAQSGEQGIGPRQLLVERLQKKDQHRHEAQCEYGWLKPFHRG